MRPDTAVMSARKKLAATRLWAEGGSVDGMG